MMMKHYGKGKRRMAIKSYEVEIEVTKKGVQVSLIDTERKIVSVGGGKTKGEAFEEALYFLKEGDTE